MHVFYDIHLDENLKEHLYVQLYKAIRKKIEEGQVLSNEKLPPIRKYANALGVNNITVINAYKLLEQQSLVYKKMGSGTYVHKVEDGLATPVDQRFKNTSITHHISGHIDINLASTTPSEHLFPVQAFKRAINHVLERDMGGVFAYQDSRGYEPLRRAICEVLLEPNHIHASSDYIQILSGAQQGLDVVAKALLDYGDTVIVEAPTYTGAIATFKSRGARILELPLEADGPNIMSLRAYIYQYKPKLLYIMPNLQNPTGIVYSEQKRLQIIELCNKHQLMILEDDYCSELYFKKGSIRPLKALPDTERVIYLKSFSKSVMPGLRLGFMTVPNEIKSQVIMAKQSTDIATSGLTQRAFEHFIISNEYKRQQDFMIRVISERYRHAQMLIKTHLMEYCDVMAEYGGFNFWLKIKSGLSSEALYTILKDMGILIAQGHAFFASKLDSPHFRITIANVSEDALSLGIQSIAMALNQLHKRTNRVYQPLL